MYIYIYIYIYIYLFIYLCVCVCVCVCVYVCVCVILKIFYVSHDRENLMKLVVMRRKFLCMTDFYNFVLSTV